MRFKYNKTSPLIITILIIAAFLRLYRLPEMANLDFDQEYASNFAYAVIREFPIQLIGQGLSIMGLFMGPLYFYFLVPFFALTNLHPIGGYIGSVILGLITVYVYFWVGSRLFGKTAGLIAALLRAILFSFIGIEWSLTPAFSSDIMVIVTLYLIYKYWHGETKYLIPLAFCFGLYTSFHPILFPFYLVFIVILMLKRKLPKLKTALLSLVAFLIPITPLIIFEFLHNFLEVKQLISLFSGVSHSKDYVGYFIDYLKVNLYEPFRIFGITGIPRQAFSYLLVISFLLVIRKKIGFWKDNFHATVLTTTSLVFILYYTVYPPHVSEYYFSAIYILIFFYSAASLSLLSKKSLPLLLSILIIISFFNLKPLIDRWNNPALTTLAHKDFIVKEILKRQPKDQEFFVSYIKHPGWNFGFDYLFKLYGHMPQTIEAKPPVYTIVIPKGLSEGPNRITSGNIHLILPQY